MNDRSLAWEWLGALSGIAFVVLILVGFGITGQDLGGMVNLEPSDSSAEIARELADQSDKVEAGSIPRLFGLLSLFWFLGYLRRHLQEAEGEAGWITSVAYGGGLVALAVFLGGLALDLATTSVSNYGADTQVAKTLFALQWNYIWLFAPPLIALTAGASAVIIRFRALPRWIGWLGVVVAVSLLMPWIGVIIFLGWVVVVSAVLLLRTRRLSATPSRPEAS